MKHPRLSRPAIAALETLTIATVILALILPPSPDETKKEYLLSLAWRLSHK
jgi:hypothetical protein